MSQSKGAQDSRETDNGRNDSIESQYREIGISAVAAAAAYTCKSASKSQKT